MNTTSKIALVILVAAAVAGVLIASHQQREPEHDGKPLSYFLSSQTYGDVRIERAAREAIRAIGSNAVPHLVNILTARESQFKVRFRELVQRQSLIRFRLTPLRVRQSHAAMACTELGPAAAPAIPALARLANDPFLNPEAIQALSVIGPETFPILTNALANGTPGARIEAAGGLRHMVPRERPVPALLLALRDDDASVRSRAAETLGALGCGSASVVPALITCLDDSDASVRVSAAQSLGWLGHAATPAIPKLLEILLQEEPMPMGWRVEEALKAIDPAAAESAGVK